MKTSRFSDSQIINILKQAEAGTPVPELCRGHAMRSAAFYKWRSKYGGMDASLMTRMKELEDENRQLKKMYAEEKLKAEIISEAMLQAVSTCAASMIGLDRYVLSTVCDAFSKTYKMDLYVKIMCNL
jgi:putative transposase